MTKVTFQASINGSEINCRLTSHTDLSDPVFCFSLMAPPRAVSGAQLIRKDGGYGEVQLPSLVANEPYDFVLAQANPSYRPINRAWLPLGAYLRCSDQIIELPKLEAGIRAGNAPAAQRPTSLGLIPEPTGWEASEGTLAASSFAPDMPIWRAVHDLASRCNLGNFLDPIGAPVTLHHDKQLDANAYRIDIQSDGIDVTCSTDQGAHYAGISLLVLREIHSGNLPCGTIEDHPRFAWRGQHLDCARHFFQPSTIAEMLDLMALLKMNRFHWHFSDDEAFRLEIDSFPEIWQQTCKRGEGELIPGVFGGGARSGGSYSKADAKHLIEHAGALFIDILPEIEFPAHALAIARARPDLRDPDDTAKK